MSGERPYPYDEKTFSYRKLFKWYKSPIQEFDELNHGMIWRCTPQGHEYWESIHRMCSDILYKDRVLGEKERIRIDEARKKIKMLIFHYGVRYVP